MLLLLLLRLSDRTWLLEGTEGDLLFLEKFRMVDRMIDGFVLRLDLHVVKMAEGSMDSNNTLHHSLFPIVHLEIEKNGRRQEGLVDLDLHLVVLLIQEVLVLESHNNIQEI
jgi:hypothetical protein